MLVGEPFQKFTSPKLSKIIDGIEYGEKNQIDTNKLERERERERREEADEVYEAFGVTASAINKLWLEREI